MRSFRFRSCRVRVGSENLKALAVVWFIDALFDEALSDGK